MSGTAPTPTPTPLPPPPPAAARPARYDFLNSKPPPNYVAGLGRGATSFTTRSDIGPARAAPDLPDRSASATVAPAIGRGRGKPPGEDDGSEDDGGDEEKDYDENQKFDEYEGNDADLFSYAAADDDDREADAVWDSVPRAAGGTETPWAQTSVTDLTAVGEGRGTVLSLKLDRLSGSISGLAVVDPKGYLTDLKSCSAAHPAFQRGCEECPKNEDVWLEACRLASPDEAKAVIARGVMSIPNSVKLWLQAAKLESSDLNKSRVLRKGLEHIPDSVRLWKAVVELANEEDARLLLHRAVECCPLHVELWLALVRLETYDQARKILDKAREKLPKEPAIWIMAAKLEEANGNAQSVNKVIERGIRCLQREGMDIDREAWLKEAEPAERAGSVLTCQAIVKNTIGIGVEDEDQKHTWVADAEECKKRGSIEIARAIYAHALTVFLTSIWLKAAQLEKSHGTGESLDALLKKAVNYNPLAEVLRLMAAKKKWLAGDMPAACAILQEAYAAIPNSEEICLAAFKLEFENNEPERAKMLLAKASERGGTERVWMKSAIVERELGNVGEEKRLLEEGLTLFPLFFKFWLMLGQMEDCLGNGAKAKEEKISGLSKSRAVLIMARKKNPATPELWLAAIRAELRNGNKKEADALLAKALQESIEMAPRPQRKGKSTDAIKQSDHDPHVIATMAKLFCLTGRLIKLGHGNADTQKDVLKRCVASEPKHGEKWQAISKTVENSHLPVEALLKKAVVVLDVEENINPAGA
ncbi:hypothetical protein BDA96_09G262600 [Sorghum bicolor]|uniref:PRP1 splicing factor N-terminal domain-containing protein n=2 Tax=Sorghum bicolor TaxID=4558 RepID=A0A921QBV9_SORBI|nr:hypothetical protein SORBI_3009G247601 [Sorghum bicolor]KAG0519419.1 hypothetical protein BDA96_09G262600 [Sorghum bicolor]